MSAVLFCALATAQDFASTESMIEKTVKSVQSDSAFLEVKSESAQTLEMNAVPLELAVKDGSEVTGQGAGMRESSIAATVVGALFCSVSVCICWLEICGSGKKK